MTKSVCVSGCSVRFIYRLVFALIASGAFAAPASAQTTVTLSTPVTHINADQTIQGGVYATTDFSSSDGIASKISSEAYTRRILFKFDTQNYIPANAVIQSAQLHLVLKTAESTERRPLTAYYVTRSFHRGETSWRYYQSGAAWSTPGADLGTRYTTTYVDGAVGSTYRFDLTSLVQRVVNGDYGSRYTRFALVDTGAATNGNYREFHSTRAANSALRPRLVITYTTSTSTSTPTPTVQTPTGTTLRVMQWNIHKTKRSDDVCDANRTADVIVAQNVHVASLNEVNYFAGDCGWNLDMGARLETLLEQKTGVAWYRQAVYSAGVGNVIVSRYPPVSSSSLQLSYTRGVAQMRILVNGRYVNLFSTHLDTNASYRMTQAQQVVAWMRNFSEPRIAMGDFNFWQNTSEYYVVATPYQDAWLAAGAVRTAFNGTGNTIGASRLDYVFYSRVAALTLRSVNVVSTYLNGLWSSDHHPVVAVFTVN